MYPAVSLSGHLGLWIFWGMFESVAIIVDAAARLYRGYGVGGSGRKLYWRGTILISPVPVYTVTTLSHTAVTPCRHAVAPPSPSAVRTGTKGPF